MNNTYDEEAASNNDEGDHKSKRKSRGKHSTPAPAPAPAPPTTPVAAPDTSGNNMRMNL